MFDVTLRLPDGFACLKIYDNVGFAERNGVHILIGQLAGQLVEHVIGYVADPPSSNREGQPIPPEPGLVEQEILNVLHAAAVKGEPLVEGRLLFKRPTAEMLVALQTSDVDKSGPAEPPPPALPPREVKRVVVRLKLGDDGTKNLKELIGRRVRNVDVAGPNVGIITEGD